MPYHGLSIWCRKIKGGPTVNWFNLQRVLFEAQGDVLVVLDCCHATVKIREEKEGKMEILAACGSGSRVPKPGYLSFTSVLLRLIQKRLKSEQHMSVKWLHTHLWDDQVEKGLSGNHCHPISEMGRHPFADILSSAPSTFLFIERGST